ncbi:XdhC family protein [Candidatus Palauibacter polyketidifaciens]|uniref:XdhC family protein n=1 Tax=Candidatus Palauibacter polyketidifaciens TaxID=3056740 RepID=UPI0023846F7D|nr:XdhC family protein [Candidatus Palauibacter polyketidifaciens]MDE2721297.1 XdhC family protein [Candidatus Palauibacter polyketidifaciens]
MNRSLLDLAARLTSERQPYALATVVRSERPTSGKPGNMALISADGVMHGWIGGSCTRSEVVRHALETLDQGEPRLLAFGSSPGRPDDLVPVPMSCSSGGKVEVHVNPVLPAPVLIVAGRSPVALALVRLGGAMGYATVAEASEEAAEGEALAAAADEVVDDLAATAAHYAERPRGWKLYGVVATMGRRDERSLAELAAAAPDYLGVIASPTRMESVRRVLAAHGLDEAEIARVRGPAGLNIGAESPEEIAVSILAEIVQLEAQPKESGAVGSGDAAAEDAATAARAEDQATDPVCGMTVPVAGSPSSVFEGEPVYFCCEGCRARFEASPEAYLQEETTRG